MDDLIIRAWKLVYQLEQSHVNISTKSELSKLIRSILNDERFQKGEYHTSTRYLTNGRKLTVEYSVDNLKNLLENLEKLLEKTNE